MSYDESVVQDVNPTRSETELRLTWFTTAAPGTWFQVYLDRVLVAITRNLTTVVPYPSMSSGRLQQINIGAVLSSEIHTDFSASLPIPPGGGGRLLVEWEGGTFESATIAGFHIYLGDAPGGAVDYSSPVGTVTAYSNGVITDGFGLGGFGRGGFGEAAGMYEWSTGNLPRGVWNVAVAPFDEAGDEGTPSTATATVSGPPLPPARNPDGKRLHYRFFREDTLPGGFGTGGFGLGGFGVGDGFGLGGFGLGDFGTGAGDDLSYVELYWLASPGY